MRMIFIALCLMFICGISFAENRIYKDGNREVVDVSGGKTLAQIDIEFSGNFVEITSEVNAKIQAEKEQRIKDIQDKEIARKQKEEKIKTKLGLSEQDWKDLQGALE